MILYKIVYYLLKKLKILPSNNLYNIIDFMCNYMQLID